MTILTFGNATMLHRLAIAEWARVLIRGAYLNLILMPVNEMPNRDHRAEASAAT